METLVWVILIAAIIGVFIMRRRSDPFIQTKRTFWNLAAQYPDEFYRLFMESEAWHVNDGLPNYTQPSLSYGEWAGPFLLQVPTLGGRVAKVYGRVGLYEQEQVELLTRVKLST